MKSWTSSKLGHAGSKTRSLGRMLEKPFVCARGQIFGLIIMKLGQNIYFYLILDEFENRSCWVKKQGH